MTIMQILSRGLDFVNDFTSSETFTLRTDGFLGSAQRHLCIKLRLELRGLAICQNPIHEHLKRLATAIKGDAVS